VSFSNPTALLRLHLLALIVELRIDDVIGVGLAVFHSNQPDIPDGRFQQPPRFFFQVLIRRERETARTRFQNEDRADLGIDGRIIGVGRPPAVYHVLVPVGAGQQEQVQFETITHTVHFLERRVPVIEISYEKDGFRLRRRDGEYYLVPFDANASQCIPPDDRRRYDQQDEQMDWTRESQKSPLSEML
jgi:hypothetical protein